MSKQSGHINSRKSATSKGQKSVFFTGKGFFPSYSKVDGNVVQRSAPNATTTPSDIQAPAATTSILCNGTNIGELSISPLFHHMKQRNEIVDAAAPAVGVGSSIHFVLNMNQGHCNCTDYNIIQVISATHDSKGRGLSYVDNGGVATPFYAAAGGSSGRGTHKIPEGYPNAGKEVTSDISIYDRPSFMEFGSPPTQDFKWVAETHVACIIDGQPDLILGGVTYGFERKMISSNDGGKQWDTKVIPINPSSLTKPSTNFLTILSSDPTVPGYKFIEG